MTKDNGKPYVDPNPTVSIESPTDSPTDSPSYPWEMENVTFYGLRNPDPYRQHERILFIMHNKSYDYDTYRGNNPDPPVSIWKVNHHDGETYFNRKQYDSVPPSTARTVWDDAVNQRWVRDDSIPPRMREGIKAMKMDLKSTSTNYALEA